MIIGIWGGGGEGNNSGNLDDNKKVVYIFRNFVFSCFDHRL